MTPRAGCRASLVALALSLPTTAAAELPDAMRISWRNDADCARPSTLEAEIERLLGAQAERALGTFEVEVARAKPSGYALRLRVLEGARAAERDVQLASCREVAEAAAVLIVTAIDPDASAAPELAPLESEPNPPRPPVDRAARRRRIARAFSHFSLLLGGLGDLKALPAMTYGGEAGIAFSGRGARASISGNYLAPQVASGSGRGLPVRSEVTAFALSLGLGYALQFGIFQIGPAAHAELGYFQADTIRNGRRERQRRPWGNALLGVRIGLFPDAAVGLELSVFAGLPLWRIGLAATVGEPMTFYETEKLSARTVLSLRISLGPRSGR